MQSSTQQNEKRLIALIILGCAAILFIGMIVGFTWGVYYKSLQTNSKKCSGYTVLSRSKVILCDGDTISHDWHTDKRGYKIY